MTEQTFEAVARPLYEGMPDDFIAARKALAAQARKAGDAPLARRISALRKPTRAAWAVNLLVRGDAERVEALLALGEELREAQEQLAGAELRALASQRRALIGEAVASARRLATDADAPLGDAVAEQLTQTLQAALADAAAAAAMETGLLVDALTTAGFEPVDLDGKVAVPEAVAEQPRTRAPRKKAAPSTPAKPAPESAPKPDPKAAERARRDAEELARAEKVLEDMGRRAAQAHDRAAETRTAVEDLQQRRKALREELDEVESALADARTADSSARKERADAERDEAKARRAAERARAVKAT
ncbi:hypothetical protein [Mumia sp. ZJ430]|uniref:hypothetical protein n=1 Tax=Mumia sp. ZJ430 TaxID=2708083 RepID=UPI001421336B|nr:hypothetical protein [Mumia sp. ZJ430]